MTKVMDAYVVQAGARADAPPWPLKVRQMAARQPTGDDLGIVLAAASARRSPTCARRGSRPASSSPRPSGAPSPESPAPASTAASGAAPPRPAEGAGPPRSGRSGTARPPSGGRRSCLSWSSPWLFRASVRPPARSAAAGAPATGFTLCWAAPSGVSRPSAGA